MQPIVATHDVYKFHEAQGEKQAILRGISLAVAPGEFVCIMGPSGSGKSTLLHLASGLDQPSAGRVELGGVDLATLAPDARALRRRRTVGYVFQFFNLLPNLNVLENVGLPLAIAGSGPEREEGRLKELLARLGLAGKERSFPHQLSGGEMQRVAIARALVNEPALLLADEPTGNLDTASASEIFELMRRFNEENNVTFLIVTHDPRIADRCERVIEVVDGRIAEGRQPGRPSTRPDVRIGA